MNVSIYQAAAGLGAANQWQDVLAENLAASSIPGFKWQELSFSAVSHGNLTITIASTPEVSQPGACSSGTTTTTQKTDTKVNEQKSALIPLPDLPTVEKVAVALNSLGVTPRDMMSIFVAMKPAGALHAELLLR